MKTIILVSSIILVAAGPALAFDPQPEPPKSQTLAGDGSVRPANGAVRAGDGSVRVGIIAISGGASR